MSTADQVVAALAAVKSIAANTDHPMRHIVWSLGLRAEQILLDAARHAHDLARLAEQVVADHDKAAKGDEV